MLRLIQLRYRSWLRAIHRDVGYLIVGLTFVYTISGIAFNHIGSWDPNFKQIVKTIQLEGPYPKSKNVLVEKILSQTQIAKEDIQAYFYDSDTIFELAMTDGSARLDTRTGILSITSAAPRFFLKAANWLHYNRAKTIWTYFADAYAVMLLFLAISGSIMLKGSKGFFGRGAILILIGAAIPFMYVQLFSGL